jgi:hypothetical protein
VCAYFALHPRVCRFSNVHKLDFTNSSRDTLSNFALEDRRHRPCFQGQSEAWFKFDQVSKGIPQQDHKENKSDRVRADMIAGAKDKTQELKFQARKMKEDNEKRLKMRRRIKKAQKEIATH